MTSTGVVEKTVTIEKEIPKPGMLDGPLRPENPLVGLYVMFYRYEVNQVRTKNFRFHGPLQGACERGRKHCEVMGYKYMFVQPLISDFETEEAYKLGVKIKTTIEVEGESK